MAVIPFRPSITSFIITVINAVFELAFLHALFTLIALHECNRLKNGKLVSIRFHCTAVKGLAFFAMIIFIVIEVLISTNSQTAFRQKTKLQPCLRTSISPDFNNESIAGEAILFQCIKVKRDVYSIRSGNYSHETGRVQCNPDVLFKYRLEAFKENEPLTGGAVKCGNLGNLVRCMMVKSNGNQLLISRPFKKGSEKKGINETFLPTTVYFDPTSSLEKFARKAIDAVKLSITDELQIRRHIMTSEKNTSCSFLDNNQEITKVSSWMVVFILITWFIFLSLFVVMLILRKRVFYDMRNTLDWAKKTRYSAMDRDENEDIDLHVRCTELNGARRMYVIDRKEESYE